MQKPALKYREKTIGYKKAILHAIIGLTSLKTIMSKLKKIINKYHLPYQSHPAGENIRTRKAYL